MGLFSRNKVVSAVNQAVSSVKKKFGGYYSQVIHIPPAMGTGDYLRSYGQIGWLFACVSKISQNVGDSEWKAYKGEKVIENSLALNVLNHPNPYLSKYEMLLRISGFLDLTGKAYLYLSKDGVGRVKEMWVVNPMDMWVIPDKEDFIKGYIYRAGLEQIPLEPNEVIYFQMPDFLNPYGGVGPTQASANALESDKYSAEWNRNFFYNNAEPQGILTLPEVGDDDFDRLKEAWEDRHKGVANARKTAMVRGEGVTYTPIQISQKDMDFFNLRQQNRDEILGTFGIHKSILGLTDDVSRANAETAEYVFQAHVIKPRLKMIQDKLNNEFVQMFGEDIELRFTDNVPENKDFIKAVLDTQVNKTLTVNEGREIISKMLGMQLKPIPEGDTIYQATSLQPIGTAPPSPTPQNDGSNVSDETGGDNLTPEEPQPNKALPEGLTLGLDRVTRKKIARGIAKGDSKRAENFIKLGEPLVKEFSSTLHGYFDKQLKAVAEKASQGSKDPLNPKDWDAELKKILTPVYNKAFMTGGKAVVNEFKSIGNYIHKDTGIKFDFKHPVVQKKIQSKVNKIANVNETTRQRVKDLIQEAYDSEEYNDGRTFTIADVTSMLGDLFDEVRARMIAQTEVLSSLNQATSETYRQNSDLIDGKYWLHSGGGSGFKPRETHIQAGEDYSEENAISVDEPFVVGGYDCDCPGDDSLPAEEVVNCHCCMSPKVNVPD